MKRQFTLFLVLGIMISVAFVACKKEKDNSLPGTNNPYVAPSGPVYSTSLAGFGQHPGMSTGTLFTLPANIKVVGHMYGGFPGKKAGEEYPKTPAGLLALIASMPKSTYTPYGYGTYVNIYLTLINTSHIPTTVIIPAGTCLRDSVPDGGDTTQGGVIIIPDTIPVIDTTPCLLKSFCTNLHHGCPTVNHHYGFSVVTNNDQFHQVINILRNKKTLASHTGELQGIIWNITDNAGLTQADIDLMNSWQ